MSPQEAVDYLRNAHGVSVAVKTLANWRSANTGPRYIKLGGINYTEAWLDEFAQSRMVDPEAQRQDAIRRSQLGMRRTA